MKETLSKDSFGLEMYFSLAGRVGDLKIPALSGRMKNQNQHI